MDLKQNEKHNTKNKDIMIFNEEASDKEQSVEMNDYHNNYFN